VVASFVYHFPFPLYFPLTIMPRDNRILKTIRQTRSGLKDPSWETIVVLQERVKFLERQVRRGKRSNLLQLEVSSLKEKLECLQDAAALHSQNRELELENLNLRNRVSRLEQLLQMLGTSVPAPLDRSFSTFEFA
jgi:FtsZ-binding cell division protein ZapB